MRVITGLRRVHQIASRLSVRDVLVLAEAIVLTPCIEIGLRAVALDRLLPTIGRQRPLSAHVVTDLERTARLVEAFFRHYPFRPSCLKKSLVLLRLARRRGMPAELRIGVRKDGGELLAHAWIECAGRTVLPGDATGQYQPLPRITTRRLRRAPVVASS
jgi:transglutaminase superfamily protein